jgi:hypothetical protein
MIKLIILPLLGNELVSKTKSFNNILRLKQKMDKNFEYY